MKLKQVMINILGNSVKFTEKSGSVTLTAEQLSEENGMCTVRYIMKDTGIGMDKEYIPRYSRASHRRMPLRQTNTAEAVSVWLSPRR